MKIKLQDVMAGVCSTFGVTPDEIRALHRGKLIVQYRQMAFYLSRGMTDASYPACGAFFCRDHTTILHGVKVAGARVGSCVVQDRLLDKCREAVRAAAERRVIRGLGLEGRAPTDPRVLEQLSRLEAAE